MKQQVMVAPGIIEFRETSIPDITDEEVLIKIMRIGICGSDIHVYHGTHPYTSYPVTQGHEVSGRIEQVGNAVDGLKPGDKITILPQVTCGKCYPCRHGQYHICDELKVMGFQTMGMASEYFAVDSSKVIKLPDTMTFEQGAMVEPLAVACHALDKIEDIRDMNIMIIGAGPIGNLVGQTAKALGARQILITDLSRYRLDLAKQVGIDFAVDLQEQNYEHVITSKFGSDKADLIIECVGSQQTIAEAIKHARKGSDIIVVGVFGKQPVVDMGAIQDHELRLIGTLMYQQEDFIQAIELIQQKKVQLDTLMSTHFDLEEYRAAYQYIEEQKDQIMKVFIDVDR